MESLGLICLTLVISLVMGCAATNQEPTSSAAPSTFQLQITVSYPTVKFVALGASSMTLRGSFSPLSWGSGIRMTPAGTNTWQMTLNVTTALPASLEFKPMLNAQVWAIGSNFFVDLPAEAGKGSVATTVFPWFNTYQGEYKYIYNVFSPQLKNTRNLVIYTPPSYLENTLKTGYPTLFMQDGQNLFNKSTAAFGCWNCQDTINQQVVEGNMEEIIIVGVDNTPDRNNEYTYSYDPSEGFGGLGDIYLDFLADTVIPVIQSSYPRADVTENTGILGSSLGGLISCYAGWTRTQRWPIAGCMSSSFWWNNQDFNNTVMIKYLAPNVQSLNVYLDSGDSPAPSFDDVVQTHTVMTHFQSDGWVLNQTLFYYVDKGGQHNEYYWGQRFWIPMTYLYPPHPSKFTTSE